MSLSLPPPIARYVQLENAGETEKLSACFAPNAIVRDESRTYEGLAAITAWKAETTRKYHHTITPLDVAYEQGKTVLQAQLTGAFPGSPITLHFDFVVEAGHILSLEIHP
jgi:SnoaL-like domain